MEQRGDDLEKTRIAVFDFRAADCAATAKAVRQYFREQNISVQVAEFTITKSFASDFKQNADAGMPYDMTFIGVDNVMGMETARNIRELDLWRPMFIVSDTDGYGLEGFRLRALDYLIKPVTPVRIEEAVRRIGMRCLPQLR
jgi:DNA-binding LytR/AlgR family response regulator